MKSPAAHLLPLLLSFCLPALALAQEKGVTPVNPQSHILNPQSATRAVVVGISDYQDAAIPDLRFADRDAEAFAAYLQTPSGGALPQENLKLLTNTAATTAQIAAALEWLVEVSREDDQVIIYFSGHGDVETKTMFQLGYLLSWDSPARTYVAGAFPLSYLQAIVSTLALQNKAQVVLITDACRAGKLAGASIGGPQATNANLTKQFANEIKILSCQPDEFAIEGEQWGGGRGVFSYHLVDGLYGLADGNGDGKVNLFEIGRYLEDKVSKEASPHSQFPMTAGGKNTQLAQVDAGALALLKAQRSKETPVLATIDSKGFEDMLLAGIDSNWRQKYRQFVAAVAAGRLLDADAGELTAYEIYLELSKVPELLQLHGTMQRNLAAALQDDAQQAVNAYLAANPTELAKRYAGETDYGRYARYLQKAAEVLGEKNFYYPYVMAKLRYFEGLKLRLDADNNEENANYLQAIERQLQALAFQEQAPFILNELGVLHTRLKLGEKAVAYYEKAIELAPEWGLPYVNLCLEQFYNNDTEKALETGEKALALMPGYVQLYNLLGWVNADYGGNFRDKRDWKREGVELSEDFMYSLDINSSLFQVSKKFQKTIDLLEKAVELDSNYAAAHYNLGPVYMQVAEYDKAVAHLKKAVLLVPDYDYAHGMLGYALSQQAAYAEGETALNKAIDLAKANTPDRVKLWYNRLGILYSMWGKSDQSLETFQKAIQLDPTYGPVISNSARVYCYIKKDFKNAERYFLKNRELNPTSPHAYYVSGNCYATFNRYQDAEYMLLKAIEIKPDFTRAIDSLINLYQKTGEFGKALEWQEKWLEIAPDNPLSHIGAGRLTYLNKEYDQADAYFQKAVELDTASWDNLNDIGHFYARHSEYERAKHYLLKVHRLKPDEYNRARHFMLSPLPLKPLLYTYTNLAFVEHDHGAKYPGCGWLDTAWAKYQDPMVYYFKMYLLLYEENYEGANKQLNLLLQHDNKYAMLPAVLLALKDRDFDRADSLVNAIPDSLNTLHQYFLARLQTKLGHFGKAVELLKVQGDLFPYGMIVRDPLLLPLHGRQDFEQLLRKNYPEKYDDFGSFEFEEESPLYDPENCLQLAGYYDTVGEHERAKFLREMAAELKAIMKKE